MLSEPQTINTVALARTGLTSDSGTFTSADGTKSLLVRQVKGKDGIRTIISYQNSKVAADPLTAVNSRVNDVISITIKAPSVGFSAAELVTDFTGLSAILTASSGALLTKCVQGEK